ncbi:ABC transporter substrate-binding protein [Caproicibacter sp.]|uniref:ABC transporter substrate-binding protein n=1 Tax=Caproicibacter sp. TaxID=2814884 RepID=UPI003989EAEE
MRVSKRILATILALGIVGSALSGCSGSSPASSAAAGKTSSGSDSAPVTVEWWTISMQPTFTDLFNGLIKDYEAEHKNVTIKWVDLPYESIQQKLITASAGGKSPDVVNLNTQMTLALVAKNAIVDLEKEATPEQKGIYIKSLYDSARVGDSVYAFPWYAAPCVMIYNKALFEKAGVTSVPKTYEEADKLAKTMKDKTGAYLYMPEEFNHALFLDGVPMLSEDKKTAAFNNDQTLSKITELKDMTSKGLLPKTGWGDWDTSIKLFETGKLAVINSSGETINRIKDEAPNIYKTTAIANAMVGKSGFVYDALMNMVVPAASKNHKAAIDFANYITNDKCQLALCKACAVSPSTIKAAADPFFSSDTSTLEGQVRDISAKTLADSKDICLGIPNQDNFQNAINKIYEACVQGGTDPKKAIQDAEDSANRILAENQ